MLALGVLGADTAGARLSVRRPAAVEASFTHCALEPGGETRPASGCPERRLVAASTVTVPRSAVVRMRLDTSGTLDDRGPVADGPALLVPEVLTLRSGSAEARLVATAGARRVAQLLADLPSLAASGVPVGDAQPSVYRDFRVLGAADGTAAVRGVPQEAVYVSSFPEHVPVRLGPLDRGRRALAVVHAWSGARTSAVVELEPLVPRAGEGLVVSFGVAVPGWSGPSPPTTFRVRAGPPGATGTVVWSRRIDPVRRIAARGWLGAEVDLSSFAGRETAIVLDAVTEGDGAPLGFPVWGAPVLIAPDRDDRPQPNVLLISLDTVRADHLSLHGYHRETSPLLDAFAAQGVIFERATSTFPSTAGSHMSMLTALHPCAHRVLGPGMRLPPTVTTLAEAFAAAGWATGAVTEDGLIDPDMGFDRGFDRYRELLPDAAAPLGRFPEGIAHARSWIDAHANRPFFFFLHTYQPHAVYKVPPHVAGRWAPGPEGGQADWFAAAYDEGLRYTDELLGGFLRALERRGILENTLVVITSDHGEEFWEHGQFGHGYTVYREQVDVPLVMRHPRLATGGRRVPDIVSLVDLAPTILELAGVPQPASFRGASFAPLLEGRPAPRVPMAFAENLFLNIRETLLRMGGHTWIAQGDRVAVYAVDSDPDQQHDLAAEQPALAKLGAIYIDGLRRSCDVVGGRLTKEPPAAPVDPERRRALEALGYLQ